MPELKAAVTWQNEQRMYVLCMNRYVDVLANRYVCMYKIYARNPENKNKIQDYECDGACQKTIKIV